MGGQRTQCKVCLSEKREQVEARMIEGASAPVISKEFGLSEAALKRHRSAHLPKSLAVTPEKVAERHQGRLSARLDELLSWLEDAKPEADSKTIAGIAREIRETLKLQAQAEGELAMDQGVQVQIALVQRERSDVIEVFSSLVGRMCEHDRVMVLEALRPLAIAKVAGR